jgi:DNA (cytosine-5)-methyltransferase 1
MKRIAVFDFFCGCGGTSVGFREAGMDVVWALDIDPAAALTFQKNFPEARFHKGDVNSLKISDIKKEMSRHSDCLTLFCGCAPCQPFTKQKTQKKQDDPRRHLLLSFARFIQAAKPDFVFVENVPGVQKNQYGEDSPFSQFLSIIDKLGYHYDRPGAVVAAQDYGAAQIRHRFIFLASRHGAIRIPEVTHGRGKTPYKTVRDAIADLPSIKAGEDYIDPEGKITSHRAAALSDINLQRIRATPHDGGNRVAWTASSGLRLKCHTKIQTKDGKKTKYSGHTDVYGRLWWDRPSTGLTTRCNSYSNGRFGHPEQDRALSIREAARIQGFPDTFQFLGSLNEQARQVGNAVPVPLAYAVGIEFLRQADSMTGGNHHG